MARVRCARQVAASARATPASASTVRPGKRDVESVEEPVAPRRVVQPAAGGQVVAPLAREEDDFLERPNHAALGGVGVIGQQERQQHRAAPGGGGEDHRDAAAARRSNPRGRGGGGRHQHGQCRHHQQVVGGQRLQRAPRGQPQRRRPVGAIEQIVHRVERQRQELHVQGLHVAEAHQRVRVERVGQPGHDGRAAAAGPAFDDDRHRQAAQREPGQHQHVVDGDRRPAEREERQPHHPLDHHVLREGEGAWLGVEDVGVEQVRRVERQLVTHPGEDPGVQRRVGVVEPRPRGEPGGERPGVHHRQRGEQR